MKTNAKSFYSFVLSCILITTLHSQSINTSPGGIKWRAIDYPAKEATTGVSQTGPESGEDWWYDHKNAYDASGTQIGYIAGGFSQGLNRDDDYETEDEDGCYSCHWADRSSTYECERFETPNRLSTCNRTSLAQYDLAGNIVWRHEYNSGDITSVIELADNSGYVATGYIYSTLNPSNSNLYSTGVRGNQTASGFESTNDLYVNPMIGKPRQSFTDVSCYSNPAHLYSRIGVVKTDNQGKIIWNYQYSMIDGNGHDAYLQRYQWADLVEVNNKIWIAGSYESYDPTTQQRNYKKLFIMRLDENGMLEYKRSFTSDIGSETQINAIVNDNSDPDQFFVSGSIYDPTTGDYDAWVAKINVNATDPTIHEKILGSTGGKSTDLIVKNNTEIVVPYVNHCVSCLSSGDNQGDAYVAVLNRSDLSQVSNISLGKINAYDIKIGITNTHDGGYAIASSRGKYDSNNNLVSPSTSDPDIHPYIDLDCFSNNWNLEYWDTDAFVAKLDANDNIEWEKQFDSHPGERQPYPYDLKKQECMYAISEDQDNNHDLVVSGNCSFNFDDFYMAKLSDCQMNITYFNENDDNNLSNTDFIDKETSGFEIDGIPHDQIVISGSQTWNQGNMTNKKIRGVIRIKSGASLTVDGITLEFADQEQSGQWSYILVEPGGELDAINGAKFTSISSCGSSTWKGIQVATSNDNNMVNTGAVDLDGTNGRIVIENATDAISTGDLFNVELNYWSSFGGSIYANDVDFKNNLRDIALMQWKPVGSFPALNTQYPAVFYNCKFIKNQPFVKPGVHRGGSVSMWDVHFITFTDCIWDFSGVDYNQQDVDAGITSVDASFNIIGTNSGGIASSKFINCHYGIFSQKTWAYTSSIEVKNTTFDNTQKGIFAYGANDYQFKNNDFKIPSMPLDGEHLIDAYGIFVRAPSSYTIINNTFEGTGSGGYNTGLIARNNWDYAKTVLGNLFENLTVGSEANLENRDYYGDYGLEYHCNQFAEDERDIYVHNQQLTASSPETPMTGIKRDQGTSDEPAGDLFTDVQFSDLAYNIDYADIQTHYIVYTYNDPNLPNNPSQLDPEKVDGNVFKITASSNYDGLCDDPGSGLWGKADWQNAINENLEQANSLKAYLTAHVDNGNTTQYLDMAHSANSGNAASIYNQFLNTAPFLSLEVLNAMAANHSFSAEMVRNIMVINTDGPKDEEVLHTLQSRGDMDTYWHDILEAQNSLSEKEHQQQKYAFYITEKYKAVEGLKGWYTDNAESEGENLYNDLVNLYGDQPTAQYQYRKAALQQSQGNFTDAETTLSNMNSMGFSSTEMAYQDDYIAWNQLLESFKQHDFRENSRFDLNGDQQELLDNLMADDANPLNANAMAFANLLDEVNGVQQTNGVGTTNETHSIDPVYLPGYQYFKKAPADAATGTNLTAAKEPVLQVYPNPSNGHFTLILDNGLDGKAVLYDMKGIKLMDIRMVKGIGILDPSANIPAGFYLIRVTDTSGFTATAKVIIE